MAANCSLQPFLRDIGTLDKDFISHHDGRRYRQVKFEVLVRHVIGAKFGNGLDSNIVFGTQTGHHFFKVLSWLAVWFVHKESDLEHGFLQKQMDLFVIHQRRLLGFRHPDQELVCRY